MKFFTISDPPLRAVIDLPTINIVQEKTTPLWSFADVHNFPIGDGNQNHVNGEQRKTPKVLIRIRKRYYGHSSTRASFEMYPAPFTIMSSTASPGQTTTISSQDWTNSEDVEKTHVKSNDFTFFVPVLLMISVILLLGVVSIYKSLTYHAYI